MKTVVLKNMRTGKYKIVELDLRYTPKLKAGDTMNYFNKKKLETENHLVLKISNI